MTPDFEADGVQLYCDDCLAVLPHLPGVDAVISDPPYSPNTHKMAKTNKGNGTGKTLIDFQCMTDCEFQLSLHAMLLISQGWVVLTCDYRHAALTYSHEKFVRLGAWVKPNPMPQISADRPGQGFETVAILHSGKRPKKWNRGGGSGVWTFCPETNGAVATQKPIGLIQAFVTDFTQPGELVLDCYLGGATTAVACIRTGRRFVGIERDPERFQIAVARIKRELAQSNLFPAAELHQKPETLPLFVP